MPVSTALSGLKALRRHQPCVDSSPCPVCRRAASRLRELESQAEELRREVECGRRRLQMVMGQLAQAEDRIGHRTRAGAIRSVATGHPNLSFDAAWALLGDADGAGREIAQPPSQRLGARELEVLRQLTDGHRTPAIAAALGISAATVEVHRRNIMRKLGLHSVATLTKYALREGLTSL